MKTTLISFLIVILAITQLHAQSYSKKEPKNNLGNTLEQLKANRVVLEYMSVIGNDGFPYEWYQATVKSFYKTNYKFVYDGKNLL